MASNDDDTKRGVRGNIPNTISDKTLSNSVNISIYDSSSIFSDGGRKKYLRFNYSHTYLSISTDTTDY